MSQYAINANIPASSVLLLEGITLEQRLATLPDASTLIHLASYQLDAMKDSSLTKKLKVTLSIRIGDNIVDEATVIVNAPDGILPDINLALYAMKVSSADWGIAGKEVRRRMVIEKRSYESEMIHLDMHVRTQQKPI